MITAPSAACTFLTQLHCPPFLGLAGGHLRDEVQLILANGERDRMSRVAQAWQRLAALWGYRLRPGAANFASLVTLLSATMRGLVIMALSMPEIAQQGTDVRSYDAGHAAQWSFPATGFTSLASAFPVPDPASDWDEERLAIVRAELQALLLEPQTEPT